MNTTRITRMLALLLLAPLAGCGFFVKGNAGPKPMPLTAFRPTLAARRVWTAQVGASPVFPLAPAVDRGAVFAASAGALSRLDAATGRVVWRVETGAPLAAGVGAGDGLELVGTVKGQLRAYDRAGHLRWSRQLSSEPVGAPVLSEGSVLVRTLDGHVQALNEQDGTPRWSYAHTVPTLVLRASGSVLASRGGVFVGFPGGHLVAMNLQDGTVGWETEVAQPAGATDIERMDDIAAAPVLWQDELCAIAWQGKIGCYDARSGTPLWSRDASGAAGLATDGHALYNAAEDGTVAAYDLSSGASVWQQLALMGRQPSGPAVVGQVIAVGDYQGYVHFLSPDDGAFVARLGTDGSAIRTAPVPDGNDVLVQTEKGTVALLATR